MKKEQYIKEAIEKLNLASSYDVENGHVIADDALCNLLIKLGYGEVVEAYNDIEKWYA